MKIEHGKTYVTVGGWIVEIEDHSGLFFASERTSPGLLGGKNVAEFTQTGGSGLGWRYYDDGVIMSHGYNHSIGNELKIVAEYPNELADPPEGYAWKGGFPKLETVIGGKEYVDLLNNKLMIYNPNFGLIKNDDVGNQRIALVVASPPQEVWPKYYIHVDQPKNWGVVRYDKKSGHFFKTTGNYKGGPFEWTNDHDGILSRGVWKEVTKEEMVARFDKDPLADTPPKPAPVEQYYIYAKIPSTNRYFVKRNGEWFNYNSHKKEEVFDGSAESFWQEYIAAGTIKPCTKEEAMRQISSPASTLTITGPPVAATNCVITNPSPVPKEEKMKSSVFVNAVKSIASRTVGATNYLYVEPTKIIGGYVKRSLRYFVLAGTVSAIVYGVNDPAALKKRIASVIPKITIEAPSALR